VDSYKPLTVHLCDRVDMLIQQIDIFMASSTKLRSVLCDTQSTMNINILLRGREGVEGQSQEWRLQRSHFSNVSQSCGASDATGADETRVLYRDMIPMLPMSRGSTVAIIQDVEFDRARGNRRSRRWIAKKRV